jgi:hypothetical protein
VTVEAIVEAIVEVIVEEVDMVVVQLLLDPAKMHVVTGLEAPANMAKDVDSFTMVPHPVVTVEM